MDYRGFFIHGEKGRGTGEGVPSSDRAGAGN